MSSYALEISYVGSSIQLRRDQWKGNVAYISNYPGLLEEVSKYTWTYSDGDHPYLKCSKLGLSLHKFVLVFLYGKDKIEEMLSRANIIEHLDNNGLNCTYENLHVLSADLNKAKAFTIDKETAAMENCDTAPALITDVYYSQEEKLFQLQVFFNVDLCINLKTGAPVESFLLQYEQFTNLYIDWLYCFECMKQKEFDINKHHAWRIYERERPMIQLTDAEIDAPVIVRDGQLYIVLRTGEDGKSYSFMNHTAYRDLNSKDQ